MAGAHCQVHCIAHHILVLGRMNMEEYGSVDRCRSMHFIPSHSATIPPSSPIPLFPSPPLLQAVRPAREWAGGGTRQLAAAVVAVTAVEAAQVPGTAPSLPAVLPMALHCHPAGWGLEEDWGRTDMAVRGEGS